MGAFALLCRYCATSHAVRSSWFAHDVGHPQVPQNGSPAVIRFSHRSQIALAGFAIETSFLEALVGLSPEHPSPVQINAPRPYTDTLRLPTSYMGRPSRADWPISAGWRPVCPDSAERDLPQHDPVVLVGHVEGPTRTGDVGRQEQPHAAGVDGLLAGLGVLGEPGLNLLAS